MDWFDFFVLLGIAQGIICSLLMLYRKGGEVGPRLLVAIILVLCGLGFKILVHTLGLWDRPAFRYFPLAIDLLVQPLLLLYVLSLTRPGFRMGWRHALHLLAPLVFIVHALVVYVAAHPAVDNAAKDLIAEGLHYDLIKKIEDLLSVLSAVVYGVLCLWRVRVYRAWLYRNVSDTSYPALGWLQNLLIATAVLGAGVGVNLLLDSYSAGRPWFLRWQLLYLYLTFLIYYLGLKGLLPSDGQTAFRLEPGTVSIQAVGKFEQAELERAAGAITTAMEEQRLYLDGELTLQKMSGMLQLSPALASASINKCLGKSFRTLVNGYRVEEVKLRLGDPTYGHLSMLGIALECGFNSEASFYRLFREATGKSPREFIRTNVALRSDS